jgi:hypothetical protein
MTATARLHGACTLLVGVVCALLALSGFAAASAGARGGARLPMMLGDPAATGAGAGECSPPIPAEGCRGLRPQDLHSAYALPTDAPSPQTIALVDAYDDPTIEKDLGVYDEEFGLPACTSSNGCFEKVDQEGRHKPLPEANGEAAVEISIDVEVAHAVCENCRILLVEADSLKDSDLETAEDRAVTLGATEISNSWYTSQPPTDSAAFNHPGIVITAAAGDYGYLNWGFSGPLEPEEIEKGSVNYPASSPHVVAVGGTRLELSGSLDSSPREWESEPVWNGYGATGSGCSAFAAPPWQLETADWSSVGCGSRRAVADVAADADLYTGVAIYDSTPHGSVPPYWTTGDGTSVASPLIAAVFALAGGAGGVEYPAKTLYENELRDPASLHDVESGSDGECAKGYTAELLSGCTVAEEAASCSGQAICVAGPGYDGPSGVGTPDGIGAFEPTGEPGKLGQAIEFTSTVPQKPAAGGTAYTVAAEASSALAVSFTSGAPFVCSVTGSTVSFLGAGTCTIDADQGGDAGYKAAPMAQQSFTVAKGSQTITFISAAPVPARIGGPAYDVVASASSGLPVSLASQTPRVCTLEGSVVSMIAAGTCTIGAEQAGNSDYRAALPEQQSFTVYKRTQVLEFVSRVPAAATVGGPVYAIAAAASSGLAVSLASQTPAVCALENATLSFLGAGTCTIDAEQAGDGEYEPAPQAQQSFVVEPAPAIPSPPAASSSPAASSPAPAASSSTLPFVASLTPTLIPTSAFSALGNPAVNHRTGAITFAASVADPGTFSWRLTFRPAKLVFAIGSVALALAGRSSFTVAPSAAARKALEAALHEGRGLSVTATLTFQSALGGPPVSHTRLIADALASLSRRCPAGRC